MGKSLAFKPRHWQRVSSCQWKNREPQFVQKLDNTAVPATKLMGACVIHGCNSMDKGTILVVRVDRGLLLLVDSSDTGGGVVVPKLTEKVGVTEKDFFITSPVNKKYIGMLSLSLGTHPQRGLLYLVCLPVCLPVTLSSGTTGYAVAIQQYQQLQHYKDIKTNVAFFLK